MTWLRIVMPVLNEGATLARQLRGLRPLRERGAELVVVDGGSTDATWAAACGQADRVLLAPRGRGAQMNAGARDAAAEVLLFLHADTTLPADADAQLRDALDTGAQWGRFDVRIAGANPLLRLVERGMNLRSRLSGIATGDQAIFVRRDLFERAGGFPEIALMEDIALCARLRQFGAPACLRAEVVTSARRWEAAGVLRTIVSMWRLRAAYFLGADPAMLARRYGYGVPPVAGRAAVAVLAKAPVPGLAKTRLARGIGERAAARAQRGFTRRTLCAARQSALGPVTLWCAPAADHPHFRALARTLQLDTRAQPSGDLGVRLRHAMAQHFAVDPAPLLLVGTDCPLLAPGHLQQAAAALARHDAVLIPATDGGYVLIGLRRPLPAVFSDIAWSTAQVLEQTRERLRSAQASWCELDPLWDVDEAQDWRRWQALLAPDAAVAGQPA